MGSAGQKGGNLTVMVANIAALSAVVGVASDVPDADPDVERGAVLPPVAISRRTTRVTSCWVANSTRTS